LTSIEEDIYRFCELLIIITLEFWRMTNYEIILTQETEALWRTCPMSTLSIKIPSCCGMVSKLKLGNQLPATNNLTKDKVIRPVSWYFYLMSNFSSFFSLSLSLFTPLIRMIIIDDGYITDSHSKQRCALCGRHLNTKLILMSVLSENLSRCKVTN
jgi:hypothetical protein